MSGMVEGRRPIIALDLGGTRVRVALVDSAGSIIGRIVESTQSSEGPADLADRIVAMAQALSEKHACEQALGIGAAVAGPLDKDGVLHDPPNLIGWRRVPFRAMLEERFGGPVWMANDANLACLGEHVFGQARGVDDLIYLTVSTGVGGGVMTGGRMVTGWRGMGAELGHIIIDPDGPMGRCGHRGCLESHVSGTAIADRAARALASENNALAAGRRVNEGGARQVFHAAAAGDPVCMDLVQKVTQELATGIVSLVHVFNPKKFILGGGVIRDWDMLEAGVRQGISDRCFPSFLEGLEVTISAFGDDVGVIGAAALVLQQVRGDKA